MESMSRSVILDIAETTTKVGRFCLCSALMRAATRIRSADPTLVPPNFITNRTVTENPFRLKAWPESL